MSRKAPPRATEDAHVAAAESVPAAYTLRLASDGFFLSFEGVDGSGKTTQLDRLVRRLAAAGREVVSAQEPGGTAIGREIRRILLDKANSQLDPRAELLLYFASRVQNIAEVIRPALGRGSIVVADRFTDATLAYQGYGRELGAEEVLSIDRVSCGGLRPDLTLWLDIDPAVGVARALAASAEQPIDETRMERESLSFYGRVRRGYQSIHDNEPDRFVRIDADGTADGVESLIWSVVAPRLGIV